MTDKLLVQFYSPGTGTRSYRETHRRGRTTHIELPFDVEARITQERGQDVGVERTGRVVLYKGPEQERIWAGDWQTGKTFTGTLPEDLEFEPTDALVLTTEIQDNDDYAVWPRCEPLYIGDPPPLDSPRWVAVRGTRNTTNGDVWLGVGYVWYPGHFPDITPSYLIPRDTVPSSERLLGDDLWAQRMTHCSSFMRSEFQRSSKGFVAGDFKMAYHRQDYFGETGLQVGMFRDGHRNRSQVQNPCGGFVDENQTAVILSAPGRVVEIDKHGVCTTLWGHRIKDDLITPGHGGAHDWSLYHPDHFELVGRDIGHCWDICHHPGDEGVVYIAATHHHCIYRGDRRTGEITVFAGTEHERGYASGLSEPRGVTAPGDGYLYIADYRNLRVVRTPLDNPGEIEEVIASMRPSGKSRYEEFPDWDGSQVIDEHFSQDKEKMRERAVWGEAGKAAFLYPMQLDHDTEGNLIVGLDLQYEIARIRLNDPVTIEPVAEINEHAREYITVCVDREGSVFGVDDILVTAGQSRSDFLITKDGENLGEVNPWTASGGYDRDFSGASRFGYLNLSIVGHGAYWQGGNTGIVRCTPKTGDDPSISRGRYNRGRSAFRRAPSPYRPSLEVVHGPRGIGQLGRETIDDLGRLSQSELRDWLNAQGRDDIQGDEFDDLAYFIWAESASGKGWEIAPDEKVEPVTPPAPQEPEEPEPKPPEDDDDEPVDEQDCQRTTVDFIATGGGRYRVVRDGEEVSSHTQYHTAISRAVDEKKLHPESDVEVDTDFTLRAELREL